MASRFCICQSPHVNTPANPAGELDELTGQGPVRRSNVKSNEAPTKAPTPPETITLPLVLYPPKDLFTKFMKVFIEMTQAQVQALAKPQKHPFKARAPKIYSGKSHMNCYNFCQQCEDYFETSGVTGINCISFAATFLRSPISLKWAQDKCRHKHTTPIIWSEFEVFFRKNLGSFQPFIDSIWNKFRRDS